MTITVLGVGLTAPPLGLDLFVVSALTGDSILKIAERAVPSVFSMFPAVLPIAYLHGVSTALLPESYR